MLDEVAVERWLSEFVSRVLGAFGPRVVCVLHHGSWARGEGGPESDIDTIVVLDRIEAEDLDVYRGVIDGMPNSGRWASGLLNSVAELRASPRAGQVQYFHGRKVLHGSLDGIVEGPSAEHLLEDVRGKASANLLIARHYLLFPHELRDRAHRLHYPFKECFYALQSWMLAQCGEFYARKDDLLGALTEADDRAVVEAARDWRERGADRDARPRDSFELLERWCRSMLSRVGEYEAGSERGLHA
ncbi:MAG: nucleotidyltransferase domain-containing protein [Armatimonadetes bacterium]|nr:nucleotidyltransferase domain-containing protein [Armatimonadota bacterium]